MSKKAFHSILFTLILSFTLTVVAQDGGLVAHWKFDNIRIELKELEMVRGETFLPREVFGYVKNSVDGEEGDYNGKFLKQNKGVSGGAVLLDGNTSYIQIGRDHVPRVKGDFSVEAWIAMGAYPNNICPIVDNQRDPAEGYYNGYFFGLDAQGRLILRVATAGQDERVVGTKTIPLFTWTHVAGTYSPKKGLRIYVNGKLAGSQKPDFAFTPAQRRVNLLIGKSRSPQRPYGTIRPYGTKPYDMFFDGLLDELKICPLKYQQLIKINALKITRFP